MSGWFVLYVSYVYLCRHTCFLAGSGCRWWSIVKSFSHFSHLLTNVCPLWELLGFSHLTVQWDNVLDKIQLNCFINQTRGYITPSEQINSFRADSLLQWLTFWKWRDLEAKRANTGIAINIISINLLAYQLMVVGPIWGECPGLLPPWYHV